MLSQAAQEQSGTTRGLVSVLVIQDAEPKKFVCVRINSHWN